MLLILLDLVYLLEPMYNNTLSIKIINIVKICDPLSGDLNSSHFFKTYPNFIFSRNINTNNEGNNIALDHIIVKLSQRIMCSLFLPLSTFHKKVLVLKVPISCFFHFSPKHAKCKCSALC